MRQLLALCAVLFPFPASAQMSDTDRQEIVSFIQQQAAILHAAQTESIWIQGLNHLMITSLQFGVGFLLGVVAIAIVMWTFLQHALIPNIDEIRDSVNALREAFGRKKAGKATKMDDAVISQAGPVLIAGALVTSAIIISLFMMIGNFTTPNG